MIMTRKASARQEESKLQLALSELKASKELCDQLNRERDDNEREFLDVLENNRKLKSEMAQLHTQCSDATDERDRLQHIVDGFDQCSIEYEKALDRIKVLEHQLHEAHFQILSLENSQQTIRASLNNSLFSELVACSPSMVSAAVNVQPIVTIDLTRDDTNKSSNSSRVTQCSRNKLKKYIKINKYIRKTQKLVKKHKFFIKNVKLNRERLQLIDKLCIYSSKLDQGAKKYKTDTENLQFELDHLREKLTSMTNKYNLSEKQMKEYMLAMNELVASCSNKRCSLSPTLNHSCDENSLLGSSLSACEPTLVQFCDSLPTISSSLSQTIKSVKTHNDIVIFSDEMGKGLGRLLSESHTGHSIINYCMPGLSYSDIMKKIHTFKFRQNSCLLIFIGNRGNVNETELQNYYCSLRHLNVDKIVMCDVVISIVFKTCIN